MPLSKYFFLMHINQSLPIEEIPYGVPHNPLHTVKDKKYLKFNKDYSLDKLQEIRNNFFSIAVLLTSL